MSLVNKILKEIILATKPSPDAMKEPRARRDTVFEAAMEYAGAYKTVKSGSIAHHTVSFKVNDADGSVVLDRRTHPLYGPDGNEEGPTELVAEVADHIRGIIVQLYPDAWVSAIHKHAIYIRFRQPLDDGQDPTVDLVVTLNRKDQPGLWIPNLHKDAWDAADPETHTKLVRNLRKASNHRSSRVIRLGKLYANQWNNPLLSSFHITALTLESMVPTMNLADGLLALLEHAGKALKQADTEDPANVSEPLSIPSKRTREELVAKLGRASDHLSAAMQAEDDKDYDMLAAEMRQIFFANDLNDIVTNALDKILLVNAVERAQGSRSMVSVPAAVAGFSAPVINSRAFAHTKDDTTIGSIDKTRWYDDPLIRQQFEQGSVANVVQFLFADEAHPGYKYTVSLAIPGYGTNVLVDVVMNGKQANVYARGFGSLYHVNHDGSLCLWYPSDPPGRRWNFDKGLNALLELVKLQLFKEMYRNEKGYWPGEEVRHT